MGMVLKFGESEVPVLDVDARKFILLGGLIEIDILPDDMIDGNTVKVNIVPLPDGTLVLRVSDRTIELDLDKQKRLLSMI